MNNEARLQRAEGALSSSRHRWAIWGVLAGVTFGSALAVPSSARVRASATTSQAALTEAPALAAARDAMLHGRYVEAERQLKPLVAADPGGEAALTLGLLQIMLGRRDAAVPTLEPVLAAVSRGADSVRLARAGRTAQALRQFREANDYFREAAAVAPNDPAINTAWGDLFLEKYNRQDAAQSYQAAIRADSNYAPAQLGLARAMTDDDPPRAMALAKRALEINPSLVPAHLLMADLELDQGRRAEARQAIDKALAINPSSLEAHALLGAIAHLEGRQADFQAEVSRTLAINPTYGELFRVAGDHAARNYRFDEAVALARQAIVAEPDNARASADIGVHLLRIGDEPAARRALERAFRTDPYDVITYNLLALLDTLDKFKTITDGDFIVRLDPDEIGVMQEYAVPLAKRALATLAKRYQFDPKGPILIEMFPRHDDFAVRNVGLPGMIGALGACFGRVVTLDSPRARPPGTFNWGATLWHEMAHVVTLQMSNQRVPRWLTEGISVYEETRARPEWGREMELVFAQKLDRGETLKLRDLNAGFTNPQTISLAYYEASLVVDHLVATYGDQAMRTLLRTYGDGTETEEAFKKALGVDLDRLQVSFDQALEKRFGQLKQALRAPDGFAGADLDQLRIVAASHANSYPVQVALGQALRKANDPDAAMRALERAAALVPMATGKNSPHALMADIALQRDDKTRAMTELEALLQHDHTDVESARRLAALVDEEADPTRGAAAYQRVIEMDPFDTSAHSVLGRLALGRKDTDTAMREFRAALAASPVDPAAAHCDLAESYLLGGRKVEAKQQTLAALEIAPTYQRAQELLLKIADDRP